MRGEDRAFALAVLDQQAILRHVRGATRATTIRASSSGSDRVACHWRDGRTRNAHQTLTAGNRATDHGTGTELTPGDNNS